MRVLVVEDSTKLREGLSQALREEGYGVHAVANGPTALERLRTMPYDVAILDLGLPRMDGLTVLRRARDNGVSTPVLILTARDAIDDRVLGLRSGADDYLIKPFALEELLARVAALARRSHGAASPILQIGALAVDTTAQRASCADGKAIPLSPREYRMLEYLALRAGKPVTRAELADHIYEDSGQLTSNAVDSAICTLRAKLDAAGCPRMIHTRRKLGYVLSTEPSP